MVEEVDKVRLDLCVRSDDSSAYSQYGVQYGGRAECTKSLDNAEIGPGADGLVAIASV